MGIESDQEILQLIGHEDDIVSAMMVSVEECHKANVYTQSQAIKYLSSKIRQKRFPTMRPKSPEDEVRELLATTVLAHVPVSDYETHTILKHVSLCLKGKLHYSAIINVALLLRWRTSTFV